MAILKIKDKGVWKEIQAIKGDTGHDVYVGDKSKAPSEAKLIIEPVKGTATGTDIQVTDSVNDRVSKLVLDGKSTQKTRSGKNLFNPAIGFNKSVGGLTNTLNPDGSITISGKPTFDFVPIVGVKDITNELEDGKVYTLSQTNKQRKFYASISAKKSDGTATYFGSGSGSVSITINKSIYTNYLIYVQASSIANWGDESLTITSAFQLEKGSTATNYEPYGVMPSPDYPSEIENIKGKNLLPNLLAQGSWNTTSALTRVANYSNVYLKAGTYTFSSNIDITKYKVWLGTGKVKFPQLNWSYVHEIQNWSQIREKTFTTTTDSYFLVMYSKVDGSNITPDELNGLEQQLEKGSFATRYVPYENIQIVETGENLFNTIFVQGARSNTNGKDTFNSNNYIRIQNEIEVEPNTTYNIKSVSSKALSGGDIHYYDKDGNFIKREAIGINITKTTPDNCYYINFQYYLNTGLTPSDVYNTQIEKGPTATNYEPYTEEVVNIDLKGNELCSLPDGTKDELVVKDVRAKIPKKIKEIILDGTGNNYQAYTNYSGEGYCYYYENADFALVPINADDYQHSICSHFKNKYAVWAYPTSKIGTYSDHGTVHRKYFISDKPTVAKFKAWLQANPVVLQYISETPEEIDLGKVSMLTTYEGTSNITNSEDTNMSIEYDTNKTNLYYQNNGNIIRMNEGS